ncbi:LAMI_0G14290g1_1 [Lachancea mirantina]|uniref:LAMI_0G14290g1_1 n=1 Tax=Lachancea mirantina TaxID=1230905 RepID=A0A1G4KC28_9SACH|nr:LAMI_0G14290g1_1 [Lachancea mirantina]
MGTKGRENEIYDNLMRNWKDAGDCEDLKDAKDYKNFDVEKQQVPAPCRPLSRRNRPRKWIQRLFYLVFSILTLHVAFRHFSFPVCPHLRSKASFPSVQQSFEITVEKLPNQDPVHTQLLLTHSFGDSWGKPAHVEFHPYKNGHYNKVVLELVTNVTGTQFDRLVHVFLDDINVWRSSTAEPWGKKTIVSESIKDITKYISLFERDQLDLTLQLDNLVTSRLDGVFNVQLFIHYYNEPTVESSQAPSLREKMLEYFTKPPQEVTPLVSHFARTPLFYYPLSSQGNPRWTRTLPEFETTSNITRAVLEIFASGNAAEEFWYTNVLDRYTSRFRDSGHELLGHGPLRLIRVYLTNSDVSHLVESFIPTPIIFSGGVSPPLWRPCVGMQAFDLEAYTIDLTPFLSILKEGVWELQIEVISSVSEDYKATVGENWILSGNIMLWNQESDENNVSSVSFENSTLSPPFFKVLAYDSEDDKLFQRVDAKDDMTAKSQIRIDGKNYTMIKKTENTLMSLQDYSSNGDVEHFDVILERLHNISILSEVSTVFEYIDKTFWTFHGRLNTTLNDNDHSELRYKAEVSRLLDRYVALNYQEESKHTDIILSLAGSQSGNSTYTLTPTGNYGSGDSLHSVRVHREWPHRESYSRNVVVEDNRVTEDNFKR